MASPLQTDAATEPRLVAAMPDETPELNQPLARALVRLIQRAANRSTDTPGDSHTTPLAS